MEPNTSLTPDVTGTWKGQWWPHQPHTTPVAPAEETCKQLSCRVICEDGTWKAVFDAQCDQYYTFSVEMEGEPAGVAVLFRGTTDLGEQGGGVYEWIGRVNDEEFVGFFISAHYVGEFRMERGG